MLIARFRPGQLLVLPALPSRTGEPPCSRHQRSDPADERWRARPGWNSMCSIRIISPRLDLWGDHAET